MSCILDSNLDCTIIQTKAKNGDGMHSAQPIKKTKKGARILQVHF